MTGIKKKIVLASASLRRSRILNECGIPHQVLVSGYPEDENLAGNVEDIVVHNAVKKAEKLLPITVDAVIIGADTLVFHEGAIIGKPQDEQQAKCLLKRFSSSRIEVHTGLCVLDSVSGKLSRGSDKSEIFTGRVTENEIEKYFKLLGPYDKAGGFSVEGVGSIIFDDIKGSYFNILGLPMMLLSRLFKDIDLDLSEYIKL